MNFKITFIFCLVAASQVINAQDDLFSSILNSLIGQWGNMSEQEISTLFQNFQQQGLNHIWNSIGDHCGSNFDCGPDACCIKPIITGKRAITDGSIINFASYCGSLRQQGQTCSKHDNSQHYYTFQCPCVNGITCVPGKLITIHPLITIQADATCQKV